MGHICHEDKEGGRILTTELRLLARGGRIPKAFSTPYGVAFISATIEGGGLFSHKTMIFILLTCGQDITRAYCEFAGLLC